MLSVIIPTYNEGVNLGNTLKAVTKVLPKTEHEVIVVDDCSTDGGTLLVEQQYPDVHFIHHHERKGTSGGRVSGAREAVGDVLCFLDAHVWPSEGFFDKLLEGVSENPGCIMAPALTQHKITKPPKPLPEKPKGTNYGGGFTIACRKMWFYMSVNRHPKRWERRHGAYACGMTMTMETYLKLGGWMTLPGYWSSSDIAMCIKAWLLDIPILIESEAHHFHGIKGFGPHETPKWHEVINRLYAAKILFSDEMYNDFWEPHLMKRFGRHWSPDWVDILNSDEVLAQQQHIRKNAVKTDEEFMDRHVYKRMDKAGIPHEP